MAINYATFIAGFPEFVKAPTTLVQYHLARATAEVSEDYFGDLREDAVFYLAAHRMALSPYGQAAKLAPEKGATTYEKHFQELLRKSASGAVVP